MAKTVEQWHSAKTGEIVSEEYAKKHPSTTYKTQVKVGPVKKHPPAESSPAKSSPKKGQ